MNMRIVLLCTRVERIAEKRYRVSFSQVPHGVAPITAELDCSAVPGMEYELRLAGVFPGFASNQVCSSDMLSFSATEHLNAIDIVKREQEKLNA